MPKQQKNQNEKLSNYSNPSNLSPASKLGRKEVTEKVNELLKQKKEDKFNALNRCNSDSKGCGCSGESNGNPVGAKSDLLVLIDTSGSMAGSASNVSDAVVKAIEQAKKECDPDLNVTYLGVAGTWSGTVFDQNHNDYIEGLHGTGLVLAGNTAPVGLKTEQGANAIEDLSKYAKWREGACRAIFYISDEELDSVSPLNDFANETAATNAAIAAANSYDVTVFAHHLTYLNRDPQILQNYRDLCDNTGGEAHFSEASSVEFYVDLLSQVICNSCGISVCTELEFPKIEPCISINWGDSDCDCLESTDAEVMTVTVCNCYTNVQFDDFVIGMMEILDEDGRPVALLPNGKPSIQLHPVGVHCFGAIAPCSCVTREFVIINEGAKAGKYKIALYGIDFKVSVPLATGSDCFGFEVCAD